MHVGGLVGGLVGIAGGLFGTYVSIRNTNGPGEMAFMVRSAIVAWLCTGIMLALVFLTPRPYGFLWMIPFFAAMPFAIIRANRKQARIRKEEQAQQAGPVGQADSGAA